MKLLQRHVRRACVHTSRNKRRLVTLREMDFQPSASISSFSFFFSRYLSLVRKKKEKKKRGVWNRFLFIRSLLNFEAEKSPREVNDGRLNSDTGKFTITACVERKLSVYEENLSICVEEIILKFIADCVNEPNGCDVFQEYYTSGEICLPFYTMEI